MFELNAHLMTPGNKMVEQLHATKEQKSQTISYELFMDIVHSDLVQNVQQKGEVNFKATVVQKPRSNSLNLGQMLFGEKPLDFKSNESSLKDLDDVVPTPKLHRKNASSIASVLKDPKLVSRRVLSDRNKWPMASNKLMKNMNSNTKE
jgi:hypothetical protein